MATSNRSFSDVLQELVSNFQEIVRSEVRLAKLEIRDEAVKAKAAGVLLGAGVLCGLFATFFLLLASVYAGNTAAELGDMVGIITVHPPETRSVSLLTSSFTIWITNVLTFSLLYWQIDAGGPARLARSMAGRPDWLFPQASAPELAAPDWRPLYVDYLSLAFNTAAAFSPTDVLPLTRRAKGLMMIESAIALLTLVLVAARAVNVIP